MNTFRLTNKDRAQKGFIALMATLIISVVLIILMAETSASSFFARFDALSSENKRVSLGLSEACSNATLLKLAQNYKYTGSEDITIDGEYCHIDAIPYAGSGTELSRDVTITTKAQYPSDGGALNGSWSSNVIQATIMNPSSTATTSPPACDIRMYKHGTVHDASTEIFSGAEISPSELPIDLGWAVTNTNDFRIQAKTSSNLNPDFSNNLLPSNLWPNLSPGESTTWVGKANGSNRCFTSVKIKQTAGQCANTVMMLDRTGDFDSPSNEKAAATALLNLYKPFMPTLGVGSYESLKSNYVVGAPFASIVPNGHITNIYSDVLSAINSLFVSPDPIQHCGTDLSAAISIAAKELDVSNNTKSKVLILISDGIPNKPQSSDIACGPPYNPGPFPNDAAVNAAKIAKETGGYGHYTKVSNAATYVSDKNPSINGQGVKIYTIHYDTNSADGKPLLASLASGDNTGFKNPISTHTPKEWTAEDAGIQDDGNSAYSSTTAKNQGYSLNFSDFTNNSTITGVSLKVKADLDVLSTPSSFTESFDSTTGTSFTNYNSWSTNGTVTRASGTGNDSSLPANGKFAKIGNGGSWICHSVNATNYKSVILKYYWRGDPDAEDNEYGVVEYHSGGSCTSTNGWISKNQELDDNNNNLDEGWINPVSSITLPDNFNGFIRFKNNANTSGEDFRIDDVNINGILANPSCQIGAELSWNNGVTNSWTSSGKTMALTDDPQTFPLGNETDNWGHAWQPGEAQKLILEIKNNSCGGSLEAGVDFISANVYYTDNFFVAPQPSDMQAVFTKIGNDACPALNAPPIALDAPTADLDPIQGPVSIGSWSEIIH